MTLRRDHLRTARLPLAAALVVGLSGAAFAFGGGGGGGGGDSGSGLNPYAALSGNDRSAGVNSGNYQNPATSPYLRAYDPEAAASAAPPPRRLRPYYGYPY